MNKLLGTLKASLTPTTITIFGVAYIIEKKESNETQTGLSKAINDLREQIAEDKKNEELNEKADKIYLAGLEAGKNWEDIESVMMAEGIPQDIIFDFERSRVHYKGDK